MRLKKEKVFRDPIHRYITVTDSFIWELINTKAFQRLNNLHQLGGSYQIFHGATHTRFAHSLGTYAIACEIYQKSPLKTELDEHERRLLLTAALLHDIGHGPYSHAAEHYLSLNHEVMGAKIILEDNEIRGILDSVAPDFAYDVVRVLHHTYPNKIISQIISGQVDADRMDYLLRDAYYAGVPYGDYDKDRIIRVLRTHEGKLAFAMTGIHALENFMVSRYHMRQQVYFNLKSRAFESLLKLSVLRFRQLWQSESLPQEKIYQEFSAFLMTNEKSEVATFMRFDDHMFMAVQHLLADEQDAIMATLAAAIIERSLPQVYEVDEQCYREVSAKIEVYRTQGHQLGFYVDVDSALCEPVVQDKTKHPIHLILGDGTLQRADALSPILRALQEEAQEMRFYVYLHETLVLDANMSPQEILAANNF